MLTYTSIWRWFLLFCLFLFTYFLFGIGLVPALGIAVLCRLSFPCVLCFASSRFEIVSIVTCDVWFDKVHYITSCLVCCFKTCLHTG